MSTEPETTNERQPDALDEAAAALAGAEPAAEAGPQDAGDAPPLESIKQAACSFRLKVGRELDTENPWADLMDTVLTCEEQFSDANDLELMLVFKFTREERPRL